MRRLWSNLLQRFWYNFSLRKKLMLFLSFIFLSLSMFSFYLISTTYSYINDFNNNVNEYFEINSLQQKNVTNNRLISKCFDDPHMDSLADFNQSVDAFYHTLQHIQSSSHTLESYLLVRSIQNSFTSYCNESTAAIIKQREGGKDFQMHYYNASRINQYLDDYIAQLLELSLREGNVAYSQMAADARTMIYVASLGIIVFLLVCLFFGFALSNYLIKPIEHLAKLSLEMSEGNLNVRAMAIHNNDEVGILARSFNKMSRNIRNLIQDLHEKAMLEKQLHNEALKNVKTEELLKEAQFLALQSQINPHFLFNTLNTISRGITFSRSDETIKLINSLAGILRYNMGNSKLYVTLSDELETIRQYLFIQQYRFGDRLKVEIDCASIDTSAVITPRFTLQPIVENAIIHGIEPRIAGGRVRIKAYMAQGVTIIKIIDNGLGISAEKLKTVFDQQKNTGHTIAIGLSNVMNRLAIFCGGKGGLTIRSKVGLGSVVIIRIPLKEIR